MNKYVYYVRLPHENVSRKDLALVIYIVELCSYIFPNVSNSVQTQKNL